MVSTAGDEAGPSHTQHTLALTPVSLGMPGARPYLLSGKGWVRGPEKWLGPGPGLQEQKGLRSGAQRGVGRWVAAHLLHTEVLRGIQELQGCRQVDAVQGLLLTVHYTGRKDRDGDSSGAGRGAVVVGSGGRKGL